MVLQSRGNLEEAINCYRQALKNKPDWPAPMNGIAWILATHPDSYGPTSNVAVGLAERAAELTQYRELEILDTLVSSHVCSRRAVRTCYDHRTSGAFTGFCRQVGSARQ